MSVRVVRYVVMLSEKSNSRQVVVVLRVLCLRRLFALSVNAENAAKFL